MKLLKHIHKTIKKIKEPIPYQYTLMENRLDRSHHLVRHQRRLYKQGKALPFTNYPLPLPGDSGLNRKEHILKTRIFPFFYLTIILIGATTGATLPTFLPYITILTLITTMLFGALLYNQIPKLDKNRQALQGEQLVAEYLNNPFRDHVAGNVRIYHDIPFNKTGNIDHLIICRQGIFLINTKTMTINLDDPRPTLIREHNTLKFYKTQTPLPYNPFPQIINQTARFSDLLQKIVNTNPTKLPIPRLDGILFFPGWHIADFKSNPAVPVMNPKGLVAHINQFPNTLSNNDVKEYSNLLTSWIRKEIHIASPK